MSQNGGDAPSPKASSPGRPRHQIKRSISEVSGHPIRLHRHQSHRIVRDTERDTRTPSAPQSAAALVGAQSERSFDWSRSEGVTPNLTPSASRRTSILYASADEVMPPPTTTKAVEDGAPAVTNGLATMEQQQKAAAAAAARERLVSTPPPFFLSTHPPHRPQQPH